MKSMCNIYYFCSFFSCFSCCESAENTSDGSIALNNIKITVVYECFQHFVCFYIAKAERISCKRNIYVAITIWNVRHTVFIVIFCRNNSFISFFLEHFYVRQVKHANVSFHNRCYKEYFFHIV